MANELIKHDKFDKLATLLAKTDKAKPAQADIAKLRAMLRDHPDLVDIAGNMAVQARYQVMQKAVGGRKGVEISTEVFYDTMRDELGYDDASAIEKSLIEHCCLSWLRLHICEVRYETTEFSTFAQGDYWERKLSSHQARYLRSVESLVRVRRLLKEPKAPAFNLLLAQQIRTS
jgi:hypothetical protein